MSTTRRPPHRSLGTVGGPLRGLQFSKPPSEGCQPCLTTDKPDIQDAAQSRALLLSGQKAKMEATRTTLNLLHNLVLHRRDAYLEMTHKSLEASEKRLRQTKLHDCFLFSPTKQKTCTECT